MVVRASRKVQTVGSALAAFLACLACARTASANPSARLDYQRGAGAETCPDADTFSARVAEHLGYDPFRPDAEPILRVAFAAPDDQTHVALELRDAHGRVVGHRELATRDPSCSDLAAGAVLTVSILLDSPSLALPAPPTPTVDAVSPGQGPVASAQAAPSAPVPPSSSALVLRAAADAIVGFGFAPAPSFGVGVALGVARGPWSLDLDARADLPATGNYDVGSIRTDVRLGELVPCRQVGVLALCALAAIGAVDAEGIDVADPHRRTHLYGAVGARAGVEAHLVGALFARAGVDVLVPLVRTTVAIGDVEAWTDPDVALALHAGVLGRFP